MGLDLTGLSGLSGLFGQPVEEDPGPTPIFYDTFTAPNGTLLSLHLLETGQLWAVPAGAPTIQNNRFNTPSVIETRDVAHITTPTRDVRIYITIYTNTSGPVFLWGPLVRLTTSQNWIQAYADSLTEKIYIIKMEDGVITSLVDAPFIPLINKVYRFEVLTSVNLITAKVFDGPTEVATCDVSTTFNEFAIRHGIQYFHDTDYNNNLGMDDIYCFAN